MELRIKSYSQDGENIYFDCTYGTNDFNVHVNQREGILNHSEYDASYKEKERIGVLLKNKAEKIMRSH